ncbi:uncharacterized protein LOC118451242 [Vespa mandarinia]|uniref:uncharacterized protein LOC118451242 n=1 Tax=Vespa mandarinia TaxID=7446 RepID=UPI00161EFB65|nr:uncharacterized protein LOC118451242 [Vespa mandarinia]
MDVIAYNHHEISSIVNDIDGGDLEESQYEEESEEIVPYLDIDRNLLTLEEINADNEKKYKFPFRRSLFDNVPPYITFQSFDSKGLPLPYEMSKHLKWRLSTITPIIVRRTLVNSGFRLMKKSQEWSGTWGKHMKSACYKNLKEFQKVNHFPGTFQVGRKDRLWRNVSRMMTKYGKREFGFVPRTYVLPQDLRCFHQIWEKSGSKEKWIIKPPASARGRGIRVVHRWSQIPKKRPVVVQQYLSKPKLIGGAKFDLRLYVLVTSFNPLKIYLYPDGLVRFASVKYVDDINYLSDRFMHLTNYSINKTSATYTSNNCADSCFGHKWTLRTLWSYLEREHVNVSKLWSSMKDIVVKTMIAGESSINTLGRPNMQSRYCCYELFGFDILLDEQLKPWLLEVNISPSLQTSSSLDDAVKGPLIKNVFNIAGFQLPSTMPTEDIEKISQKYQVDTVCLDLRLHRTTLSYQERHKQSLYANLRDREDYIDEIIEDLTPDDVRHLIAYEDELTQLDRFEKIFPTSTSHEYMQFFDVPRYYNMLLDAWEFAYGDNREKGISRLQKLCQAKYHLEQQVVYYMTIPRKKRKDVSTGTSHGKLWSKDEFEDDEGFAYEEITERLLTTARAAKLPIEGDRSETDRVDKKPKLPMRESLFAHVPPYIIFHGYDKNGASLPPEITRHLLWWHTKNFSPRMIRLTVLKSGFTMTEKSMANWSGTWCNKPAFLRTRKQLKKFQKINHFQNCQELSNKINLWRNINRMAKVYGNKSFNYMPYSYVLPTDYAKLKRFMDRKNGTVWILKPGDSCAGHGIRLVSRCFEIPRKSSYLAQRYLWNPSLINGYKYDIRLYVLLTSIDPLRIFIYTEGLVRLATVKYHNRLDTLNDRFMHLTNTSINKLSPRYRGNDDPNKQQGNMWSLTALWNYLRFRERANINNIWRKIKGIVIKSIISAENSLIQGMKDSHPPSYNNCQLFGFDVLLDVRLEPWLLEVNDCPSMSTETPLCAIIKGQLARDFLNLVGFHVPDILKPTDVETLKGYSNESQICYDRNLYDTFLSKIGEEKQRSFENNARNNREYYLNVILRELTPEDVRVLIRHEDELAQTGRFEKIFPTCNTYEYFKYFDKLSYYNMLLDAWEHTYGNDRLRGIDREKKVMNASTNTISRRLTSVYVYDDRREKEEDLYELITEYLLLFPPIKKNPSTSVESKHELPLRASLFPHVAPYVEFQAHNAKARYFPQEIQQHLQWDLTSATPSIVRKIVEKTGYRLLSGCTGWCGAWNEIMYTYNFSNLKNFQKVNHFPGSYEIGHKDRLCRNVRRLILLHGKKRIDFIPRTYILPHDLELLLKIWNKDEDKKWILKPPASSRGRGIKVISNRTQIPRTCNYLIIQRYLSRPKLINGNKFDLRLYVLVTSIDPLRVYFYEDGLVRFASNKYRDSLSTLHDRFMHLTNYSINKYSSDYTENDTVDSCKGHKWSLKCLWNHLEKQAVNTGNIIERIHDMIVKTIVSAESCVNNFSRVYAGSWYNCYELFGIDVLLDENLKPWLLEVNACPSLQTPSLLDETIKGALIRDTLNLVSYRIPAELPNCSLRQAIAKSEHSTICHDFRLNEKILTNREKLKQLRFLSKRKRQTYLNEILQYLTADDVRQLIQYEDELNRLGSYRKIFPTKDTHKYFKYFTYLSYYNRLFDAWETAYGRKRNEAVQRLRELCNKKFHLRRHNE